MNRAASVGWLCTAALVLALSGCAGECVPRVSEGWIRGGPAGMPMRAGFARIVNDCDAEVVITGATSPAFADVSLHETTSSGGVSRMRPVPALHVPANGETLLAPGGLHLMLSGPRGGPDPGSRVEVVFELSDGGSLRGEFEVR